MICTNFAIIQYRARLVRRPAALLQTGAGAGGEVVEEVGGENASGEEAVGSDQCSVTSDR